MQLGKLKQRHILVITILSLMGVFYFGGVFQSTYDMVTGVWDVDVELNAIRVNGVETHISDLEGASVKTYSKIVYDPDGDPSGKVTSMSSFGLIPTLEWSLGSLYCVGSDGHPAQDVTPCNVYIEGDVEHRVYKMGFSLSMLTRSSHPDIPREDVVYNFDYYGTDLNTLYEYPEFAPVDIGAVVGIRVNGLESYNVSYGIVNIELRDLSKTYTVASSMGYDEGIDEFNNLYDWEEYHHQGRVQEPEISPIIGAGGRYDAYVVVDSHLAPASEYIIDTDFWGGWTGGSFNVFDVELLVHFIVMLDVTYPVTIDLGDELDNRFDVGGTEEPNDDSIFAQVREFFDKLLADVMTALGLDNPIIGWIVLGIIILVVLVVIRTALRFIFPSSRQVIIVRG